MSKAKTKDKSRPKPDELFYGGAFTTDELALVAAFVSEPSLNDELWLQRVVNHRLFHFWDDSQTDTPIEISTLVKLAAALGAGTVRVARLLRDRQKLSGSSADGLAGALAAALDELTRELGIEL